MAKRHVRNCFSFARSRTRPSVEALEARFAPAGFHGPLAEVPEPVLPLDESGSIDDASPLSQAVASEFVGPMSFGSPGDPTSVPEDPNALPRAIAPGEVVTREHFDQAFEVMGRELPDGNSATETFKQYDFRRADFLTMSSFDTQRPLPAEVATRLVFETEHRFGVAAEEVGPYGPKGVGGSEEASRFPVVAMRAAETPEPPRLPTRQVEARPVGRNGEPNEHREENAPEAMPPGDARPDATSPPEESMSGTDGSRIHPEMNTNGRDNTIPREFAVSATMFLLPGSARAMSRRYGRGMVKGKKDREVSHQRDRPRGPPALAFA